MTAVQLDRADDDDAGARYTALVARKRARQAALLAAEGDNWRETHRAGTGPYNVAERAVGPSELSRSFVTTRAHGRRPGVRRAVRRHNGG